jgi:hypothetical protein
LTNLTFYGNISENKENIMELTKEWLEKNGFVAYVPEGLQNPLRYERGNRKSCELFVTGDMDLGGWITPDDYKIFDLTNDREKQEFSAYVDSHIKSNAPLDKYQQAVEAIVNFLDCFSYTDSSYSVQRILDILVVYECGVVDDQGCFNKN